MQGWEEGAFRARRARGSGGGAGAIGDTFTAPVVKDADGRAGMVAAEAFEVPNKEGAGAGDVPVHCLGSVGAVSSLAHPMWLGSDISP